MERFDFVIIGAGSAGCVLAERLSASGRHRVLLLEAGGSDRRLWVRLPIGYGRTFHDPAVNWRFASEPEAALGGRSMYLPRGRGLGGSSAINGLVWCRGLPRDFEDWRAAGNSGWGWAEVAPEFERIEAGGAGAMTVSDRQEAYHPVRRHFLAAAREAGLPEAEGGAVREGEGVGAYRITTRRGLRCSAADAFLRPALGRRNLALRTHARVTRIEIAGGRAAAVVYERGGRRERVAVEREVVLAAGAVHSPQLLQLSGIGPGALLQRMGIAVRRAVEAVGAGLQDHLGVDYLVRATEPTLNQVLGSWRGRVLAGLRYLLDRGGPLGLSVNQMGGLVKSREGLAAPDLQLYFNPLSYSVSHAGRRPLLEPDRWPGFAIGFNACRPTSRGRVELAAPDPAAAPRIAPNYLSTNEDVAEAVAGARLIGRLLATAGLRRLVAEDPVPDPVRATEADLLADFRARAGTVHHLCGTCRMAPEAEGGVVDPALRVHGVRGLRVADASVFPNITSANTNAPAMLVGARAAGAILAEHGGGA